MKRFLPNVLLVTYCLYLALPLYWLMTMALRRNEDILGPFEWFPESPTLINFVAIFTSDV